MTLSTTSNRADYVGTGSTGPFPFIFPIRDAAHLEVRKLSVAANVETVLTLGVDYTVAGVGDAAGGSVTLLAALNAPDRLVLRRIRPVAQATSIRNQGAFSPEIHEDAFDDQVMIDQQHDEVLSRALKLPVSTAPSAGISAELPPPSAGLLLGWDPTGKKLVNTQGTPGATGPAGPALVANAAARDALYPAPAADQRVVRKDSGYQERFDQTAGRWLPETKTGAAGPLVLALAKGARGDGVTDDAAALAAMDAAVAAGGKGEITPSPTGQTYYVNSVLTFSNHLDIPAKGAIIELGPNAVVTIAGPFTAGDYQVFKYSGGRLIFTSTSIAQYRLKWWGVKGDYGGAGTDDTIAWQFWAESIPEWSQTVMAGGMRSRITDQIRLYNKWGVHLLAPKNNSDTNEQSTMLVYTPPIAPNRGMFADDRCGYFTIDGLVFNPGAALCAVDTDMTWLKTVAGNTAVQTCNDLGVAPGIAFFRAADVGRTIIIPLAGVAGADLVAVINAVAVDGKSITLSVAPSLNTGGNGLKFYFQGQSSNVRIGSNCLFRDCTVWANPVSGFVAFGFSVTQNLNEEYHRVHACNVVGTDSRRFYGYVNQAPSTSGITLSTTNGSPNVVAAGGNPFVVGDNGKRIRAPGIPDGTTMTYVDATHATLSANATATAGGLSFIVGYNFGIGVLVGGSFNAKSYEVTHCQFNFIEAGWWSHGGSMQVDHCSYSGCEKARAIDGNQGEASYEDGCNEEQCCQGLVNNSLQPFSLRAKRMSTEATAPGKGYIECQGAAAHLFLQSGTLGHGPMPSQATLFDFRVAGALRAYLYGIHSDTISAAETGFVDDTKLSGNCFVEVKNWYDSNGGYSSDFKQYCRPFRGGQPLHFWDGTHYWHVDNGEPADGSFAQSGPQSGSGHVSFSPYIETSGSSKHLRIKMSADDGTFRRFSVPINDKITVVDAGTINLDCTRGHYFVIVATAGVGAARTIGFPPVPPPVGGLLIIDILNSTGGAIVTTFNGTFKLPAGWADPANTKRRLLPFIWDGSNFLPLSQSSGDF